MCFLKESHSKDELFGYVCMSKISFYVCSGLLMFKAIVFVSNKVIWILWIFSSNDFSRPQLIVTQDLVWFG